MSCFHLILLPIATRIDCQESLVPEYFSRNLNIIATASKNTAIIEINRNLVILIASLLVIALFYLTLVPVIKV